MLPESRITPKEPLGGKGSNAAKAAPLSDYTCIAALSLRSTPHDMAAASSFGQTSSSGAPQASDSAALGSHGADGAGPEDRLSHDELMRVQRSHFCSNVTVAYDRPIHMVRARGCEMHDGEGGVWLDCVNNVAHVGHCDPGVVAAQSAQLAKLNTNARYLSTPRARYTRALLARFPPSLQTLFLCNSGSEANELALRVSRAARPGAEVVVVMEGAYHGHTAAMNDCSPYKFWGPRGAGRPDWVHMLPLPDSYRGTNCDGGKAAAALVAAVEGAGRRIAAFYCESAISCGGQLLLPPGYLEGVYRVMRAHGAVCIADEVQSGFGRIGSHFWAFEEQGVEPDIVVLGKAMGNGYPVSAIVISSAVARAFSAEPAYFNTFAGNDAACVSAHAVLDTMDRKQLQRSADLVGAYLLHGLRQLQSAWGDVLGDVRGRGLFIGIEIVHSAESKAHAPGKARWLKEHLKYQHVLVSTDGPWENVIKIKPPMVFSKSDADKLLAALKRSLHKMAAATHEIARLEQAAQVAISPNQAQAAVYFEQMYPDRRLLFTRSKL